MRVCACLCVFVCVCCVCQWHYDIDSMNCTSNKCVDRKYCIHCIWTEITVDRSFFPSCYCYLFFLCLWSVLLFLSVLFSCLFEVIKMHNLFVRKIAPYVWLYTICVWIWLCWVYRQKFKSNQKSRANLLDHEISIGRIFMLWGTNENQFLFQAMPYSIGRQGKMHLIEFQIKLVLK